MPYTYHLGWFIPLVYSWVSHIIYNMHMYEYVYIYIYIIEIFIYVLIGTINDH